MTTSALMFTPTKADMLLSFIYTGEYHSQSVMAFEKNSKVAWPTALEGMKASIRRGKWREALPPPRSRRQAALIEAYKLKMIPEYNGGGEWLAWERGLASTGASTSKVDDSAGSMEPPSKVNESAGSMEPPSTTRAPRYYEEESMPEESSEDDYLAHTLSSAH